MAGDEAGALPRVLGGEDGFHLGQRVVELAQPVNDLGGGNLLGRVVPVAGEPVHHGWLKQPRLVISPQGTHAELG